MFLSTKEKVKKVISRALKHTYTALPPHVEAQLNSFIQPLFLKCLSTARNTANKNFASKILVNWAL